MSKSGLGKAIKNKLQRKQRKNIGDKAPIFYQQTQENEAEIKKMKMKSIIQQNSLNEFLQTAELSQQNFQANRDIKFSEIRQQMKKRKIINIDNKPVLIEDQIDQKKLQGIQMPRRPTWKDKTKQELQKSQAEAYLIWRRLLAQVEQKHAEIQITPYEKNIEVWRQLWRVTERSDLMVQIVDGRDPLFFRCEDLVRYVKSMSVEHKKLSLLLINKSDLVPEEVRLRWNKYFTENGINHIFFSAKQQLSVINEQESEQTKEESVINAEEQIIEHFFNKPNILTAEELITLFTSYTNLFGKQKIEVGLVGYPNVGKSSVINTLLGKKKVGVASMPGKTKHFQTLILNEKVTLCDCPGLVFPRISASVSYMILNGLYSIDTLKSYEEPMKILTQRIDEKQIQKIYSVHWKEYDIYDWESVLTKYAQLKGFFTGSGLPNISVSARNILKDYVNGVLQYARNPPGLTGEEILQNELKKVQVKDVEMIEGMKKKEKNLEKQLDEDFFKEEEVQKLSEGQIIDLLSEEDLLDLIEGKKICGLKVTKQIRKQIKHALKRGQDLEKIKKTYFGKGGDLHKCLIKN